MFKPSDISYLKNSNYNKISLILSIGCGLNFNRLFKFLRSLRKRTWFVFGQGCVKMGIPIQSNPPFKDLPESQNIFPFLKNELTFIQSYF